MRYLILLLSIVFSLSSTQAFASDVEAQLLKCRAVSSDDARVGCYDRIADSYRSVEQSKPTEPTPVGTSTAVRQESRPVAKEATKEIIDSEELFGKREGEAIAIVQEKLKIKQVNQIRSPVVKVQQNLSKEFVVLLENGQIWKQKGDGGTWRIRKGDVAVISKAAMGSFMMKVEGRKKGIRAVRVK